MDAIAGAPLTFTNPLGWTVSLTTATMHVGAMYLVQTLPASGGGPSACVLPGTYVAEVTTDRGQPAGIDVDMLSPTPQPFPHGGQGTDFPAKTGQVWLTAGPIDQTDGSTSILHVEGTAQKGTQAVPFVVDIKIDNSRIMTPTDSSKPGSKPICHEHIVSPIQVDIVPRDGGTLLLRLDPRRQLFDDIDFSALKPIAGDPSRYGFVDDSILYLALHSTGALYQFSWDGSSSH
jgi:hypothetical protein